MLSNTCADSVETGRLMVDKIMDLQVEEIDRRAKIGFDKNLAAGQVALETIASSLGVLAVSIRKTTGGSPNDFKEILAEIVKKVDGWK